MEGRLRAKPFGESTEWYIKLGQGWCFLLGIIALVVCPMLLFSTLSPNYMTNNPISGEISMDLSVQFSDGRIREFHEFYINELNLKGINKSELKNLQKKYKEIDNDYKKQIQVVTIPLFSENDWLISPPRFQLLKQSLLDIDANFFITLNWKFDRNIPTGAERAVGSNTMMLSKNDLRQLHRVLTNTSTRSYTLNLDYLLPSFIRLGSTKGSIMENWNNLLIKNSVSGAGMTFYSKKTEKFWYLHGGNRNDG